VGLARSSSPRFVEASPSPVDPSTDPNEKTKETPGYRQPSEVSQDELIASLKANAYRLAPTAKALGISRTSLYALIESSSQVRKATDIDELELREALQSVDNRLTEAAAMLEISVHALKLRVKALGL
jgi:transcriptional regulator of acetoin/glycerol metabolism